jgi:hypothetical protein
VEVPPARQAPSLIDKPEFPSIARGIEEPEALQEMGVVMAVEHTLSKLQRTVRLGQQLEPGQVGHYSARVPSDLHADLYLTLTPSEFALMQKALQELELDLRFEHLFRRSRPRAGRDGLWRFICRSYLDRDADHVAWFLSEYGHEIVETTCYFPVHHLVVQRPLQVGRARLIPAEDATIPRGDHFSFPPPCEGVVAIPTKGTNAGLMRGRARAEADHTLRLLRVGLREDNRIRDEQLRFRLGTVHVFDTGAGGWRGAQDAAWQVELSTGLEQTFIDQPLASLEPTPSSQAEQKAAIALRWLDRGRLATDEVVRTLYYFFALEALLGDPSEGKKALSLTFRRTMLSLVTESSFSDPLVLFYLYEQVRSSAVHGSEPPPVDPKEHRSFDWSARTALNEYLSLVRVNALRRQSELIQFLENHEEAPKLLDWLRARDERWDTYEPGSGHGAQPRL